MKFIKKVLFRAILTEEERRTIVNALNYSIHRYRRANNAKKAKKVTAVAAKVNPLLANEAVYTAEEVTYIVNQVRKEAREEAIHLAAMAIIAHREGKEVLSRAKCERCEHKDDCPTYAVVFGEEETHDDTNEPKNQQGGCAAEDQVQVKEERNEGAAGNEEQPSEAAQVPETSAENNG